MTFKRVSFIWNERVHVQLLLALKKKNKYHKTNVRAINHKLLYQ